MSPRGPIIRYLDHDQTLHFFTGITNPRDRALFATIYQYGLRVSEAVLLKLDDLDLARNRLLIRRVKNGIGGERPLFNTTVRLLEDYLKVRLPTGDALDTAWRNLEKLRKPEAFPAWLRRIVVWQCFYYRRANRQATVPVETLADDLVDERDIAAWVEQDDLNRRIRGLIAALPKNAREILVLHYMNEYSHEEIACFLDLSAGAVRKRLHDAHKRLKAPLGKLLEHTVRHHMPSRHERPGGLPMRKKKEQKIGATAYPKRTPEDIIAGMIKPAWCEHDEQGRIVWDLFCAAIRNDVDALRRHPSL